MILLSLLLAAAPVILEPDAGNAHRLHPRRVTASSFLENGWNKHEQNYLPLYIADEDPTTAWVEGVKGRGEGESIEWWGPALTKAKAYRLFVRNGFQKTDTLFRANARPRKVKLEPLVQGETGPQTTGTPLEVELKDVRGWQEVVLPVPAKVAGVRLTLVTTYPGGKYEDTCLSDLRVYVEGEDPYRPEAEAAAFEEVRSFAYERKQAAARKDTGAKLAWAPRYTAETLLSQVRENPDDNYGEPLSKRIASVPDKKAYHDALVRAREVTDLFLKADLDQKGPASEARATWTRVKPAQLKPQRATARAALSAMEHDGLVGVAGLLHLGDVSFFEADTTQAQMLATLARTRKQETAALKACVKQCVQHRKDEPLPAGKTYDCDCEAECTGCYEDPAMSSQANVIKYQLEGGEFIQGPLANPTAFLRGKADESGTRESWLTFRQTLVRYAGDKADVVLLHVHGEQMLEEDEPLRIHVLEWTESGGKARLASITSFLVNSASLRVVRYRPASRT
ncbi:hypothetical protein D7Y13_23545 [Corallococcus praedator]|uniref:NAD glycohydrolase translocation F5/8 type C domain-containing protein n=1 Tax=Corallococcus praedator TaxID=2316724 RepID=A0ABX9QFN7_9BACT|nr:MULTISPECIES: hypothetical protein [Corallococcus]RKH25614.1 hypothetical protein D7X75_29825 [Corallococcus sp. CA031C]RKI02891.1 hypothetical protein D7Y13_23545 [Corallococcus praedator]